MKSIISVVVKGNLEDRRGFEFGEVDLEYVE
jgi:hypothetical protein